MVFNPANPDTSVEDCLAGVGDRVAQELDTYLATAVHTLVTGSAWLFVYVTIVVFREESCCQTVAPKTVLHVETLERVTAATCRSVFVFIQYEINVCANRLRATIEKSMLI